MDPFMVLVFTFILLMVLLVGGFILAYPLTRRLGAYLERLVERPRDASEPDAEVERLRQEVDALRREVSRLAERQEFTDALLAERPERPRLGGK